MAPKESPSGPAVLNPTLQAASLSALSNILAQLLTMVQSGAHLDPSKINLTPVFRFVLFALLNTPPNVLWQDFLESTFPGQTVQPKIRHVSSFSNNPNTVLGEKEGDIPVAAAANEYEKRVQSDKEESDWEERRKLWKEEVKMEKKIDWYNTLIKFALDQTLGALVNTIVYISYMAAVEGKDADGIWDAVSSKTLPLMIAGYKVWPLVSLLCFTVIPPQSRIIFGSLVGVGWGIFLSLVAAH